MAEVLQQQWQQLSLLLAEVLSQRDVDLFHLAHQFSALGKETKVQVRQVSILVSAVAFQHELIQQERPRWHQPGVGCLQRALRQTNESTAALL